MGAKHAGRKQLAPLPVKRKCGSPLTSQVDIDYDAEEMEFLKAIEEWKKKSGRKFPSFTEMLGVLRSLGWKKQPKE